MPYPLMPKVSSIPPPAWPVVLFDSVFSPRNEVVNGSLQFNSGNPANRWRSYAPRHDNGGFFVSANPGRWQHAPRLMQPAVFLDRDGTLIEDKDYLHKPEEVVIFPGAIEALKRLQDAGFKLVMVTNQSGVGRGYFTMADVDKVHEHIQALLARSGVSLEKIYVAPEAPDQPSRGRKPSPQFLFDARDQLNLDLGASYMIGDKLIDLECGWNAGVKKSILVRTGYGAGIERKSGDQLTAAILVDGMGQAAEWILANLTSD